MSIELWNKLRTQNYLTDKACKLFHTGKCEGPYLCNDCKKFDNSFKVEKIEVETKGV